MGTVGIIETDVILFFFLTRGDFQSEAEENRMRRREASITACLQAERPLVHHSPTILGVKWFTPSVT